MDDKTDKAVRDILARWAAALPNHPYADFAQKVSLTSVVERPSYVVRLMTLYDSRGEPQDCRIPFKEGAAPTEAGDIWSQPSGLEADFIRHETRLTIPVSAEPAPCTACEGGGKTRCKPCAGTQTVTCPDCTSKARKSCTECGGLGKIACHDCQGKGAVLSHVSAMGQERSTPCQTCAGTGGPPCPKCSAPGVECPTCANKRFIPCKACGGAGSQPCAACEGQGRVLKGRSYLIEYQPLLEREVFIHPETPKELLPGELPRQDLGTIVYDVTAEQLDGLKDPLPDPTLQAQVDSLRKKAETGKKKFASEARVIKQRLSIDRIPIYSVQYDLGGRRYSLWATTLDNKVLAPASPFTELAGDMVGEAQKSLSEGKYSQAEQSLAKAAGLAPWPWLEGLKQHARQHQGGGSAGGALELACAGAAAVVLALGHRASHNLFWPAAGAFAAALLLAKGAARLLRSKGAGPAALAAGPLAALIVTGAVWAANPFAKLDTAEFEDFLGQRFPSAIPPALTADDESFLKILIGLYEPLGVDVGEARAALDANAKRIQAEKEEARKREEAAKAQAEAEARKKREEDAIRASIRASLRSSSPKKKKKRKSR